MIAYSTRDGELRLFDTLPNETRREQAKSDSLGPPTAGVLYGARRYGRRMFVEADP